MERRARTPSGPFYYSRAKSLSVSLHITTRSRPLHINPFSLTTQTHCFPPPTAVSARRLASGAPPFPEASYENPGGLYTKQTRIRNHYYITATTYSNTTFWNNVYYNVTKKTYFLRLTVFPLEIITISKYLYNDILWS